MKHSLKRVHEIELYILGMNEILRRHYNLSGPKRTAFWDRVWEQLKSDPDTLTETVVEQEIGVLRDRQNNRKPESA